MHKILDDVDIVAFDIMGVIITEPSLISKGLFPIYQDRYSYDYVKKLYRNIRTDIKGDISLWEGLEVEDPEKARKEFLDIYEVDENFEKFRTFLSEMEIGKGIISNMPKEWGEYFINKLNLKSDFKNIILSGSIGIKKPDKGIYEEFLKYNQDQPNKILFIDDKLSNLETVKQLGVKTVMYDRGKEQEGYEPDLIIKSFEELM
jgi:putative hydrolase of the HAD superfamily